MKNVFWNEKENRLRFLVRLISTIIVIVLLGRVLTFLNGLTGSILPSDESFDSIVIAFLITISMLVSAKFIDKRQFENYGLNLNRIWFKDFSIGLLLGAILMILIFIAEYMLGWIEITGTFFKVESFLPEMIYLLLGFIAVGFWEELFMRGYLIKNFAEGFESKKINKKNSILLSIIITSIFFGAVHMGNPNYTIISLIGISLIGLLFALSYIYTGRLGIAIGLHISWNYIQGPVLGFPVSGISTKTAKLIEIKQNGPEFMTGGEFGPEAGLIGILGMIIGFGLMWIYIKYTQKKLKTNEEIATYNLAEESGY